MTQNFVLIPMRNFVDDRVWLDCHNATDLALTRWSTANRNSNAPHRVVARTLASNTLTFLRSLLSSFFCKAWPNSHRATILR